MMNFFEHCADIASVGIIVDFTEDTETYIVWEPLKTGVKSKNGQGVPASRKADEVRLYALRGGLTTKMVRTAHFRSHEVFRGDHILSIFFSANSSSVSVIFIKKSGCPLRATTIVQKNILTCSKEYLTINILSVSAFCNR